MLSRHSPRDFDPVALGRCDLTDPRLAAERRALIASYSALLDTVSRVPA